MAKVTLRIGASVDRSIETVFRSIETRSRQAAKVVQAELTGAMAGVGAASSRGARVSVRAYSDTERAAKRAADAQTKSAEKAADAQERATKRAALASERAMAKAERDYARHVRQVGKEQNVSVLERGATGGVGLRSGINAAGGLAGSVAKRVAGAAAGIAASLARGAGVETDIGALASKNVSLESGAVALSNSGYMKGDARNGVRQDPGALVAQARSVANTTGFGANDVIGGLAAFTAKTGDLATGRAALADLAKLSKATGANLEDVVDASADVSNNLGEIPDKAKVLSDVMAGIAGQGKIGAVEMKDFAAQMAKVAAAASQFSGGARRNIQLFGALAQESRARGGSASATQAATSVQSFTNTFSKGARLKAFNAKGIETTDKATGLTRSARDIIIDSLRATKGDAAGMGDLFKDAGARRVTRGFETIYHQAGGGEAGIAAVTAEFEKLQNATMDSAEIQTSFNAAMGTSETKATLFNNKMQEVTGQLQDALYPALVKIAPAIVEMATAGAKFVTFLTELGGGKSDQASKSGANAAAHATDVLTRYKQGKATFAELQDAAGDLGKATAATKDAADPEKRTSADKARVLITDALTMGGGTRAENANNAQMVRELQMMRDILKKIADVEQRPGDTRPVPFLQTDTDTGPGGRPRNWVELE